MSPTPPTTSIRPSETPTEKVEVRSRSEQEGLTTEQAVEIIVPIVVVILLLMVAIAIAAMCIAYMKYR